MIYKHYRREGGSKHSHFQVKRHAWVVLPHTAVAKLAGTDQHREVWAPPTTRRGSGTACANKSIGIVSGELKPCNSKCHVLRKTLKKSDLMIQHLPKHTYSFFDKRIFFWFMNVVVKTVCGKKINKSIFCLLKNKLHLQPPTPPPPNYAWTEMTIDTVLNLFNKTIRD